MTLPKARVRWEKAAKSALRLLAALSSRRLLAALGQAARSCHWLVREIEPWGILVTVIGVGIALFAFAVELEDRQVERTFRAWQIVLSVPSAGSSGRETFEYLNREFDGSLCGAPVQWVSRLLTGNRRRRCLFPQKEKESLADIEAAGANLEGADLEGADLRRANLRRANLRRAFLTDADLVGAFLTGADLTDADLGGADLTGAFLRDTGLTQPQLDSACGRRDPIAIPVGLTWRSEPCPENPNE